MKLAMVYGVRMLPAEEIAEVRDAEIVLANGRTASVTMHLIEGESEEDVRKQLMRSLDAFFEFYPEV